MAEYGIYLSAGTLLSLIIAIIKLVWQISRIEKEIYSVMEAKLENIEREITIKNNAGLDRADTLRQETGEVGAALRTKIHEVEVWTRDTMVRKDSFEFAVSRIEKSIEKMVDKLEQKLDRTIERFHGPQ